MFEISTLIQSGYALVPIPLGKKGPIASGWNLRECVITDAAQAIHLQGMNIGVAHAYCTPRPTCAVDIDDYSNASKWFREKEVSIEELICHEDAVVISSGKRNSVKLLYRMPEGIPPKPSKRVKGTGGGMMFELRCASSNGKTEQDVLPPSLHPAGKRYQWIGKGTPLSLPTIPPELLDIWRQLSINSQLET